MGAKHALHHLQLDIREAHVGFEVKPTAAGSGVVANIDDDLCSNTTLNTSTAGAGAHAGEKKKGHGSPAVQSHRREGEQALQPPPPNVVPPTPTYAMTKDGTHVCLSMNTCRTVCHRVDGLPRAWT